MIRGKLRTILLSVFLLQSFAARTQGSKIDSLQKELQTQNEDTARVNTLNALSFQLRYINTDTSLFYANAAHELATKLGYEIGIADSKVRIGMLCATLGKYDEGAKFGNDALVLYKGLLSSATATGKQRILQKIGSTYNVIGHNRISQGNYPEGLKNSFLALKIRKELGDKKGISDTEYNIGNIYAGQHNYAEALNHYWVSLELSIQLGVKSDIATAYNAIGLVYFEQGKYPEALKNYLTALQLARAAGDKFILGEIYITLGIISAKQENYHEALKYEFDALKVYQETGNNESIAWIYNNIGVVYMKQKKYNDASEYLNKALSFSKKIGSLEYIKSSYENQAALDSAQGYFKRALGHYKLYVIYRDSLFNGKNTNKLVQQQMQYGFDIKEAAAKANQFKKDATAELEIKNQRLIRNFSLAGGMTIFLVSAYGFYWYYRKKKLQNLKALINERLRISAELHDEVGSTLSGIAMYSHLASQQNKNAKHSEVEKSLSIMQQTATEMVNKLNDIVWLINPEKDSLQQLVQRLEEYATNMAALKYIKVKINTPVQLHQLSLPVESRRNIYLFCKEAINNAVKYSNGSLLEFRVEENNGHLKFSVNDDGKGFDEEMIRRGNGLQNMKRRAEEMGAIFSIQSNGGIGSFVSMQLKIT